MRHRCWQSVSLSGGLAAIFVLAICGASGLGGLQADAAEGLAAELQREQAAAVLADARAKGDAISGAVLFAGRELACAICHNEASADRIAPDLRRMGAASTDEHLLESLLFPSQKIAEGYEVTIVQTAAGKVVPLRVLGEQDGMLVGRQPAPPFARVELPLSEIDERAVSHVSAMAEGLPDLLQSRQQFLDLLRYLMQLRDQAEEVPLAERPSASGAVSHDVAGAVLFDQFSCRACHDSDRWQRVAGGSISFDRGPLLADVRSRWRPAMLIRYLEDPQAVKPGSRMPSLLAGEPAGQRRQIATELAHFLLSRGSQEFLSGEAGQEQAARGAELFHSVGCVACHSPRNDAGRELMPEESVPLGNLAERASLDALVRFLEEPTTVRPAGRMPDMQLAHAEAVDLAHYLMRPSGDADPPQPATGDRGQTFLVDADLARAGEQHYRRLACDRCHEPQQHGVDLVGIRSATAGCLSEAGGAWPAYTLTAEQRTELARFVGSPQPAAAEPLATAMATLRCTACHQRDGVGGIDPDRDHFFQTTDINLGPQGRLPPSLTGVGDKLRPEWLRQVLVSGRSVRPYMKTRMPRFGREQVEPLIGVLIAADDAAEPRFPDVQDEKQARDAGHELAGSQGLNCIACHTFQRMPAATMSAVDLTEMAERLQRDWFFSYMLAPQSINPGTVMPSFWPGGKAIRRQILDGDTQKQLEALWVYLEDGRLARAPRGLVLEPLELLAGDEAVMLRRSWPGVGKRGIGVGYPEQVNLVFDAEQMRLATVWKGKFADPGGVWRSQGHGAVRPLGGSVVQLAEGPDLTNPAAAWEATEVERRPPGFRFGGYELDALRRPRFRYRADDVEVEEFFRGSPQHSLQRTIVLTGRDVDGDRHFRLLSGEAVVRLDENRWQTTGGITLALPGNLTDRLEVVTTGVGQELRLVLPGGSYQRELEVAYSW